MHTPFGELARVRSVSYQLLQSFCPTAPVKSMLIPAASAACVTRHFEFPQPFSKTFTSSKGDSRRPRAPRLLWLEDVRLNQAIC